MQNAGKKISSGGVSLVRVAGRLQSLLTKLRYQFFHRAFDDFIGVHVVSSPYTPGSTKPGNAQSLRNVNAKYFSYTTRAGEEPIFYNLQAGYRGKSAIIGWTGK
jgi:hypothetical protein